jgi:hypothetical protein
MPAIQSRVDTGTNMPRSTPMNNLAVKQTEPDPIILDDLVTQINKAHGQVEQAFSSAMDHALVVGDLLLKAKSQLKHGEFKPWITNNCEFSDRMARAYMRVAEQFPKLPDEERQRVADMSLRGVLKLFASPGSKPRRSRVIRLDEVGTADLIAELETREPAEAEQSLFRLINKWADAAGNEIIVRPKMAAASETAEQASDEEMEEDPLAIPPFLDRRDEAPDKNHEEDIPPQPQNQENNNG